MDAIPAMPVSPAPVTDAASNPRDAKGCEADARGFGDQLKHEIAARATDAKDAPPDEAAATDATTDDKADKDAASADAQVALDPAVAALLGDTSVQQPIAVALPLQPVVQQAAVAAAGEAAEADAGIAAVADAKPAGVQRVPVDGTTDPRPGERPVKGGRERAGIERGANTERSATERSTLERASNERGVVEHAPAERSASDRAPGEPRDFRPLRDADERTRGAHDKSGIDTAASLMNGFTVDRGTTALDAPAPVAAASSTLDSLTAALGAKWGSPIATSGADAAPAPATARVDTPLGSTGWGEAFQQKVVWMVDRELDRAELHVNPAHLGPIDVMLNLTGDGAQIAFASPHAAVRDAIEASLSDLRNALDQRGLSLGQATVGADSGAAREQFAEQARQAASNAQNGRSGGTGSVIADTPSPARAPLLRRGLVDTFA